jgi:hypothetical protein
MSEYGEKISEHGENSNRKCGPPVASTGMYLQLLLISATLPWGKRNMFPLIIPMYARAVVNDLVSPQQDRGSVAPAQSCIFDAAVTYRMTASILEERGDILCMSRTRAVDGRLCRGAGKSCGYYRSGRRVARDLVLSPADAVEEVHEPASTTLAD